MTFWELFQHPELRLSYPRPSDELVADLALVYAEEYGEFYKKIYGYRDKNIKIVGMPFLNDLDAQDSINRKEIRSLQNVNDNKKIAVYIEDANVESGSKGWTTNSRLEYLKEISELCRNNNVFLVIKLHPGNNDKTLLAKRLTSQGNTVVLNNYALRNLIRQADFVIGHVSTVLMFAVTSYKPILIPQWGIGGTIPDRFSCHGVGVPLKNKKDFTDILKMRRKIDINHGAFETYMKKYIGPVDGKCMDRIVDYIMS